MSSSKKKQGIRTFYYIMTKVINRKKNYSNLLIQGLIASYSLCLVGMQLGRSLCANFIWRFAKISSPLVRWAIVYLAQMKPLIVPILSEGEWDDTTKRACGRLCTMSWLVQNMFIISLRIVVSKSIPVVFGCIIARTK